MLIKGSSLKVIDNSGAKWSKCIKVVGKSLTATTGDILLITLSKFVNRKKIKKRTIYFGLIAGVKFWVYRFDGSSFKFFSNKVLIFNKQYKYLGTRVYGAVSKEIKIKVTEFNGKKRFYKVFAYINLVI